jgi:DNA-binding CsgD family transcriptional regulator
MNMTSKEIADIMGISDSGVKKARYRLRKKMNLEDSELQGFLLSFA